MNQKEIRELIEFLVEKDIAEFSLERGDVKLHVKRGNTQPTPVIGAAAAVPLQAAVPVALAATASPAAPPVSAAAPSPIAPAEAADADLFVVKSPIVGTFYEAPSPGAPPFVKVGDVVQEGQVLCIIEAMKLMNEIEAEVAGEVARVFVANSSPVEYGMPLFGIRKK